MKEPIPVIASPDGASTGRARNGRRLPLYAPPMTSQSPPPVPDDAVTAFQIEGEPVRGRLARLGPAIDEILRAHAYPEAVANLLGEACAGEWVQLAREAGRGMLAK